MKEKTRSDIDREIMPFASKWPTSPGEALFRAKSLDTLMSPHPESDRQFGTSLERRISTLNQIDPLYRHDFAHEIESRLHRKIG